MRGENRMTAEIIAAILRKQTQSDISGSLFIAGVTQSQVFPAPTRGGRMGDA